MAVDISEIELTGCMASGSNISLLTVTSPAALSGINAKSWYKKYADEGAKLGLFKGSTNGAFNGEQNLTQGQAAKVIVNLGFRLGTIQYDLSGTPIVDECNEFFPYVQTLKNKRVITGTTFDLTKSIDIGTFCHYLNDAMRLGDVQYYNSIRTTNIREVYYPADVNIKSEAERILKLVNIDDDGTGTGKYKAEGFWEFVDVSNSPGRVTSNYAVDATKPVTRAQMAKVIYNAYLVGKKSNPSTTLFTGDNKLNVTLRSVEPTLADMAIIGEKPDNAAITVGNPPNAPNQVTYTVNSGTYLDIYYTSESDNSGNPLYFQWSMFKIGANLVTQNANNSRVRFTPPTVSQTTTFYVNSYVANNKGMIYEEFITVNVNPPVIVTPTAPTIQAANLQITGQSTSTVALQWQRGNGQSCIVLAQEVGVDRKSVV